MSGKGLALRCKQGPNEVRYVLYERRDALCSCRPNSSFSRILCLAVSSLGQLPRVLAVTFCSVGQEDGAVQIQQRGLGSRLLTLGDNLTR